MSTATLSREALTVTRGHNYRRLQYAARGPADYLDQIIWAQIIALLENEKADSVPSGKTS